MTQSPAPLFNRLALIGVGLIGSSIARAARRRAPCVRSQPAPARLQRAGAVAELGIADQVAETNAAAVAGADLVIVCAPVGACGDIAKEIGPHLKPGAVVVLVEDGVALGFAHLLEDDLLGHLGGDAAERRGVLVEAELTADFDFGREFAGSVERELVGLVGEEFRGFDYRFVDVGADFTGFLIHLGAHVFGGFVVLARGEGDRVLDGGDDDFGSMPFSRERSSMD